MPPEHKGIAGEFWAGNQLSAAPLGVSQQIRGLRCFTLFVAVERLQSVIVERSQSSAGAVRCQSVFELIAKGYLRVVAKMLSFSFPIGFLAKGFQRRQLTTVPAATASTTTTTSIQLCG